MGALTGFAKRWAPATAAAALCLLMTALALRTPIDPIRSSSLPAPIGVSLPIVPALDAEVAMPLFTSNRSNQPASLQADAPTPTPAPTLVGVVIHAGRAVALLKSQSGATVLSHLGEAVDGWTIHSIMARAVELERDGETQRVELTSTSLVASKAPDASK